MDLLSTYAGAPLGIPLLLSASVCTFTLWYILTSVQAWRRLRAFPGPLLAQFSDLWLFTSMATSRIHEIIADQHVQYGKAMRIGPNAIMVFDPETLGRIGGARSAYTRSDWYRSLRFDFRGSNVFTELDTATHDRRKAQLHAGFYGRGEMDLEVNTDAQIRELVGFIRGKIQGARGGEGKGGGVVGGGYYDLDLNLVLKYFQVDLISLAGTGKPWGDLADEKDHFDYLVSADALMPITATGTTLPLARNFLASPIFLRFFGPKNTDKSGLGRFMGVLRDIIGERLKAENLQKSEHSDMLGEWIKTGLSQEQLEIEMAFQVPAGTETTLAAIRGTMMYLMTSPTIYQKLKHEISTGIKEDRISTPITNEEGKALPYLQAVINEGIRLNPPFTVGFAKKVPLGGDTICGKRVPAGTDVFLNMVAMLKNKDVFGEDAGAFRPERFLQGDEATLNRRFKAIDLAFGTGRWMCLGKTLAWMELNKIYVELLRAFDFQILNPERPWKRHTYLSIFVQDFPVRATEGTLT